MAVHIFVATATTFAKHAGFGLARTAVFIGLWISLLGSSRLGGFVKPALGLTASRPPV